MTRGVRSSAIALLALLLTTGTVATASASGTDVTLSPTSGLVGTAVTIDAQGATTFPLPSEANAVAPVVAFNGVPATSVTVVSAMELTTVVPVGATTGTVTVAVGSTTYTGPTFTVTELETAQPVSWATTLSRHAVSYGEHLTITGVLTSAGVAVPGMTAQLQAQSASGATWTAVAGAAPRRTNSAGLVSWIVTPSQNAQYRITSSATTDYLAGESSPDSLQVGPKLTLRPLGVAPAGIRSHLVGTVRPAVAGTVRLELRIGGAWRSVAQAATHNGTFSFPITPNAAGLLRYRAVEAASPLHAEATSHVVLVRVVEGELRYGSSGPSVLALQDRLRQLHYDVGPRSASYGWDMVHAVTAFEKVQGISRDGVAGAALWRRLGDPKAPHLLHPYPGKSLAVEINLSKQILMLAKYGRIWRILDTSTGGGYTFTGTSGQPSVAITPTGHFAITYKVDHLVVDTLGSLWRPSYFNYSGDAIHGEGDGNSGYDVPPYPASHGCVRITDLAADRYYNLLAVGTPVWIY